MVTRFSYTLFTILYCFCGAIANTCHAMSALISPYRLAVFECDIVHRAVFNTLTASDTSITRPECGGFNEKFIKDRIYRTAHKTVIDIVSRYRERLLCLNTSNDVLNRRLSIFYNYSCFLCFRYTEHGNIVFRHKNLICAHIA